MTPTKPMLAVDFNPDKAKFPYIVMPKIDGVRGLKLSDELGFTARSLKPFGNKQTSIHFSEIPTGFDGEIVYGSVTDEELCRTTTSVLNTHDDPRVNDTTLYVFDYVTEDTVNHDYLTRLSLLDEFLQEVPIPHCEPVKWELVETMERLVELETEYLAKGYEGIIARDPYGMYKNGRSTVRENTYLRLKRFVQEDAIVNSITEAMENTNEKSTNELGSSYRSTHKANMKPKGMVGALNCTDIKSGLEITVGPGAMSHTDRIYYFNNQSELLGKTISYKSFPKGKKDKPRFPTFVNIRPEEDLVKD